MAARVQAAPGGIALLGLYFIFNSTSTPMSLSACAMYTGRSITIVTLDAGYGVARVFAELEARRIEAIVPTRREPSPKKGVIPARRFKLDARHDRLRCPRGRHLVPHSIPCPLRAACFSPNAQRRTVLLNKDHPALLRGSASVSCVDRA